MHALISDIESADEGAIACDNPTLGRCGLIIGGLQATGSKGRHFTLDDVLKRLQRLGFAVVDQ